MAYGVQDSEDATRRRRDQSRGAMTLPYDRAFVVQFTVETDNGLKRATGRVEHLETGRRATFRSVDELLESIVTLLPATRAQGSSVRGRQRRR